MAPKSKRTEQVASNIGNDASAGPAIKKPNNEEEKPKNEVDKFFDAVETVKNREQYVQVTRRVALNHLPVVHFTICILVS